MSAPSLAGLLAAAPAAHRRVVAGELGLPADAPEDTLAAAILDRESLARSLAALPRSAWRLLAGPAFAGESLVCTTWGRPVESYITELERRGLVFAFRDGYEWDGGDPAAAAPADGDDPRRRRSRHR